MSQGSEEFWEADGVCKEKMMSEDGIYRGWSGKREGTVNRCINPF